MYSEPALNANKNAFDGIEKAIVLRPRFASRSFVGHSVGSGPSEFFARPR
jgi:hypothetical protein